MLKRILGITTLLLLNGCAGNYVTIEKLSAQGQFVPWGQALSSGIGIHCGKQKMEGVSVTWTDPQDGSTIILTDPCPDEIIPAGTDALLPAEVPTD